MKPRHSLLYAGLASAALAATFVKFGRKPPTPEMRLPFNEVVRGSQGHQLIALTFDAGGEATGLSELLASLRVSKLSCTFFITGGWASKYPLAAREIVASG